MDSCYVLGLILGVFLAISIQSGDAIHCHVCNSHKNFDGSECADPYDGTRAALVDCEDRNVTKKDPVLGRTTYDLCRKTLQVVEGSVRIDRSCGTKNLYPGDKAEDYELKCTERTGSHDIKVTYCETAGCNYVEGSEGYKNDEKCNSATTLGVHTVLFTVVSAVFALVFLS